MLFPLDSAFKLRKKRCEREETIKTRQTKFGCRKMRTPKEQKTNDNKNILEITHLAQYTNNTHTLALLAHTDTHQQTLLRTLLKNSTKPSKLNLIGNFRYQTPKQKKEPKNKLPSAKTTTN